MTDEGIVELFFNRDEYAIEACDLKYGSALREFGKRISGEAYVAEECANDTYLKTWNTVPPKDPRGYLFAFLSKIMRNLCLDRVRMRAREKRGAKLTVLSDELSEAAPGGESSDGELLCGELAALISNFLRALPNEKREIFVMRYFYMEELSAIAAHLSVSEGKVKTVLKRLRDKLRIYLSVYGYDT